MCTRSMTSQTARTARIARTARTAWVTALALTIAIIPTPLRLVGVASPTVKTPSAARTDKDMKDEEEEEVVVVGRSTTTATGTRRATTTATSGSVTLPRISVTRRTDARV